MTVRVLIRLLTLVLTGTLVHACSGGSSGGVYNQAFNVSGQWTGTLSDSAAVARTASMTLSDGDGTVTGTLSVVGHTCISGGSLTGTAVQAPANTTDDNPLTSDQENSNQGTVNLTVTSTQASGGVSAVTIALGGEDYSTPPAVSFSTPPSGGSRATGVAILGTVTADTDGQVAGIIITDPGSGYVIAPTVTITAASEDDDAQGAQATATIDTATVTDSVTFTLTGSSSSLTGQYSGVWKSTTTSCASQTQGTITLSRL
ncbi:MAG: hypothetical protein CL395_04470 [Acidiferrobacteraceae bacterium]|jgi:hypothetical protein|nr:hypothetical protein [Acidiferrobacteraceae bacterium]